MNSGQKTGVTVGECPGVYSSFRKIKNDDKPDGLYEKERTEWGQQEVLSQVPTRGKPSRGTDRSKGTRT